jgi:hypothetical protein
LILIEFEVLRHLAIEFDDPLNGSHTFEKFAAFAAFVAFAAFDIHYIVLGFMDVDENLLFANLKMFLKKFIIFCFLLAILIFLCRYTKTS